jgi:hypothetical protein
MYIWIFYFNLVMNGWVLYGCIIAPHDLKGELQHLKITRKYILKRRMHKAPYLVPTYEICVYSPYMVNVRY